MKYFILIGLILAGSLSAGEITSQEADDKSKIQCGNIVYADTQSSVCFADKFLTRVATETSIKVARTFRDVKLSSDEIYSTPFCVMSGEGDFTLPENERLNFRKYLENGGFVLASPNCSDKTWNKAFLRMMESVFPKNELKNIPMSHPVFNLVNNVKALHLKSGGTTKLQGLFMNERLVMVYSKEGLNDVGNAKGCCCCGGNEIKESQLVNVNIFTYSVLH